MDLKPACLALLLLPFHQGCKPLLYPLARAFGGAPESELKLRRAAFERLKSQRTTARILVAPVLDPRREQPPVAGSAASLVEQMRANGWSGAAALAAAPAVAATPLGRNQLRYLQTRAGAYSEWAKAARPQGDFLVIVEVLSGSAGIGGIHCYVLERSGQVAYLCLQNSHHFGADRPADAEAAGRLALRLLARDLERTAEEVYPPWGVG